METWRQRSSILPREKKYYQFLSDVKNWAVYMNCPCIPTEEDLKRTETIENIRSFKKYELLQVLEKQELKHTLDVRVRSIDELNSYVKKKKLQNKIAYLKEHNGKLLENVKKEGKKLQAMKREGDKLKATRLTKMKRFCGILAAEKSLKRVVEETKQDSSKFLDPFHDVEDLVGLGEEVEKIIEVGEKVISRKCDRDVIKKEIEKVVCNYPVQNILEHLLCLQRKIPQKVYENGRSERNSLVKIELIQIKEYEKLKDIKKILEKKNSTEKELRDRVFATISEMFGSGSLTLDVDDVNFYFKKKLKEAGEKGARKKYFELVNEIKQQRLKNTVEFEKYCINMKKLHIDIMECLKTIGSYLKVHNLAECIELTKIEAASIRILSINEVFNQTHLCSSKSLTSCDINSTQNFAKEKSFDSNTLIPLNISKGGLLNWWLELQENFLFYKNSVIHFVQEPGWSLSLKQIEKNSKEIGEMLNKFENLIISRSSKVERFKETFKFINGEIINDSVPLNLLSFNGYDFKEVKDECMDLYKKIRDLQEIKKRIAETTQ